MTDDEFFIEFFETSYGSECQCGKCGSDVEWIDCSEIDCEDGYSDHDCGEDCCCCLNPEPNVVCDTCEGHGGWWYCSVCKKSTNDVREFKPASEPKPTIEKDKGYKALYA